MTGGDDPQNGTRDEKGGRKKFAKKAGNHESFMTQFDQFQTQFSEKSKMISVWIGRMNFSLYPMSLIYKVITFP